MVIFVVAVEVLSLIAGATAALLVKAVFFSFNVSDANLNGLGTVVFFVGIKGIPVTHLGS